MHGKIGFLHRLQLVLQNFYHNLYYAAIFPRAAARHMRFARKEYRKLSFLKEEQASGTRIPRKIAVVFFLIRLRADHTSRRGVSDSLLSACYVLDVDMPAMRFPQQFLFRLCFVTLHHGVNAQAVNPIRPVGRQVVAAATNKIERGAESAA